MSLFVQVRCTGLSENPCFQRGWLVWGCVLVLLLNHCWEQLVTVPITREEAVQNNGICTVCSNKEASLISPPCLPCRALCVVY
jgi:hypothetical protein